MNICIFGDSITWGASDTEKGGWVERLKTYFGNKYEAIIYNLGIPGDTTIDLLKRVESECKSRKPDLIIFSIGINDLWRDDRTPIKKFAENIARLHRIAKKIHQKRDFYGAYAR
ncbi:MAG: hypothetical protein KGJ89_02590 [Patescibacteria group bacterium]|nr:hypothetical protein [Patescibacteria group bacterium]MDE2015766.1 hypothetical protein [Patescibacteria group bacterium]MDE2226823.1 hypothetical protein [Patescibacteria group bacterium]